MRLFTSRDKRTETRYAPPIMATIIKAAPKVGMVSLGCPKALVDSERILTKLRADGYGLSPDYAGADIPAPFLTN